MELHAQNACGGQGLPRYFINVWIGYQSAMSRQILKIGFRNVVASFKSLVRTFYGLVKFAFFKICKREIVPGRAERRLFAQNSIALRNAAVVIALHEEGRCQSGTGLKKLGIPAQSLFQSLYGFVGFAALEVDKADVAPRNGEFGPAVCSFVVVTHATFKVAALHTDAAELNIRFSQMGRVAHCFKEGGFRFDKVSF